jgi:hypothetical protein
MKEAREARRAAADLHRRLQSLPTAEPAPLGDAELQRLGALVECAREAAIRAEPERGLTEIATWAAALRERIAARSPTGDDLRALYSSSREFFVRRRRLHRFPGAHLVKAFNLAIKGLHYETVMTGIVRAASAGPPRAAEAPRQLLS